MASVIKYFLIFQSIGAVVGAISHNLADLKEHHGDFVSRYDQPAFGDQVLPPYTCSILCFHCQIKILSLAITSSTIEIVASASKLCFCISCAGLIRFL